MTVESLPLTRVSPVRRQAYERAACPMEYHRWARFADPESPEVTVLILCETCGRTPLEGLMEMPVAAS